MMNFDQLKNEWQAEDADLDTRLQLNKAALRQQLLQQSQKAVRRLRWFKVAELLSNGVMVVLLLAFCLRYQAQAHLLWSGIASLFVQLCYAAVAWSQHRDLQSVDYSQAVRVVQQRLEELRERRLQSIKYLVVLGFAVWPAFSIVLLKGLIGIDLLRLIGGVAMSYYIVGGLILALLLWLVWTAIAALMAQQGWLQALRRDAAGATFNSALNKLQAVQDLEQERDALPSVESLWLIKNLRRAPLLAIYAKSALMILLGIGNAMHGGQVAWMIPGITLTVFTGIQIGFSAMQLNILRNAKQASSQTLLLSIFSAYEAAVKSNCRWLTATLPITLAAIILLTIKLSGLELVLTNLMAVMVAGLMLSLVVARTAWHHALLQRAESWTNWLADDAMKKLQADKTKSSNS